MKVPFKGARSLDSILGSFNKTVDALNGYIASQDAVAANKAQEIDDLAQAAARAGQVRKEAQENANKASAIKSKIEALIA